MKKLFVLLSALMLIFAVSCSNDTPSVSVDAVMIDPIEIPETTDNLSGDVKAAFDEILGEITMESEFENVILKTDVQAFYYEGKCIANAVLADENTFKMTIVSPVAGFMPGDTIIEKTNPNKIEINGNGDFEAFYAILYEAEQRSLKEGSESLKVTINGEEYNLDFDYKSVNIDRKEQLKQKTSHIVVYIDNAYKGLPNVFEVFYDTDGDSRNNFVYKSESGCLSINKEFEYDGIFRAIECNIDIPW